LLVCFTFSGFSQTKEATVNEVFNLIKGAKKVAWSPLTNIKLGNESLITVMSYHDAWKFKAEDITNISLKGQGITIKAKIAYNKGRVKVEKTSVIIGYPTVDLAKEYYDKLFKALTALKSFEGKFEGSK